MPAPQKPQQPQNTLAPPTNANRLNRVLSNPAQAQSTIGPFDLKTFLTTPKGQALKQALLTKELAKQENVEEMVKQAREEKDARYQYMAFLCVAMLMKRAFAMHKRFDEAQKEAFHKIQNEAEQQLKTLEKIAQQRIEQQQKIYETHTESSSSLLDSKFNLENAGDYLKDIQKSINDDLEELQNTPVSELKDKIASQKAAIESQLQELDTTLKELGTDKSNPQVRSTLFHKNSLQDQLNFLNELDGKLKNSVIGQDGEADPILKNAIFAPMDKKIVKDGDKIYLINATDDLATMSPEAKLKAEGDFKDLKNDGQSLVQDLKSRIDGFMVETVNLFQALTQELDTKLDALGQTLSEINQLQNDQQQLQVAQSIVNKALNNAVTEADLDDIPTPKPKLVDKAIAEKEAEIKASLEAANNSSTNSSPTPMPGMQSGQDMTPRPQPQSQRANPSFQEIQQRNAGRQQVLRSMYSPQPTPSAAVSPSPQTQTQTRTTANSNAIQSTQNPSAQAALSPAPSFDPQQLQSPFAIKPPRPEPDKK